MFRPQNPEFISNCTTMAAELDQIPNAMPKLITSLSSLLRRVSESNDGSRGYQPQEISAFHGLTRPSITIQSYVERIFKYANCSPSCYLVAYVYLDRFTRRHPELRINSFNVHRLFITSVLVSAKFMDDIYYNNAYYAKVGGISTTEMNFLEVDFLFGLRFQLHVTPTTFQAYCSNLQREMMLQPHLDVADQQPSLGTAPGTSSSRPYLCVSEEESSSSHQQQQQQLAV